MALFSLKNVILMPVAVLSKYFDALSQKFSLSLFIPIDRESEWRTVMIRRALFFSLRWDCVSTVNKLWTQTRDDKKTTCPAAWLHQKSISMNLACFTLFRFAARFKEKVNSNCECYAIERKCIEHIQVGCELCYIIIKHIWKVHTSLPSQNDCEIICRWLRIVWQYSF